VKTSPQYYKVLLENDQVRVLEYRLKAGEKEPMHSHPAGVVFDFPRCRPTAEIAKISSQPQGDGCAGNRGQKMGCHMSICVS